MILNVALAAGAACDLANPSESERIQARRASSIAKRLKNTSTILFDCAESRTRSLQLLEELPASARGIWLELLQPNSPYARVDPTDRACWTTI